MARPLVIGNGQMLICYDDRLVMRDLYYPHVGQTNHIVGRRNQLGVWVDGHFNWVSDDDWEKALRYTRGTLVTDSKATHRRLGLAMTIRDAVHHRENIFVQHVRLHNLLNKPREARVFAAFDFDLDETDVGDTALWDPTLGVIFHYKRKRCFLMGAQGPEGGIYQYATGRKRFQGAEGTWRDAEDGHLEGHPISQGAVDSTVSVLAPLAPGEAVDLFIWIVCAQDFKEARRGHQLVLGTGPNELLQQTESYWRTWAEKTTADITLLPQDLQEAYLRSVLIVRTQVDNQGAIIAANDSDILEYNRDHYSYMWPRDGALVAGALDRAGHRSVVRRFFKFCKDALSEGGYLWHKYNPDGTVGSSWHPWVGKKGVQLPIQEDETALVLWAMGQYTELNRSQEFVDAMYPDLIRPAADFLVGYRDERTKLPLESYDLWEERRGIFTFTVAAVVAGLRAAAEMAGMMGDHPRQERYARAAAQTREAMIRYLWSDEHGYFLRGVYVGDQGELVPDPTLESSVMGVFYLGVLPVSDPKVEATMRALEKGLWCKTSVGGIARYYNDYYFRVGADSEVTPGNPWIICTLWLARWYIARARTKDQLKPGTDLIYWALNQALPTGVLPEQVNPFTGEPLSVAPLTWSHATVVDTLLDLAGRLRELN